MNSVCPHCGSQKTSKRGFYKVLHSGRHLRRYYCTGCRRTYSRQTRHSTYRQHRPELNEKLLKLITSGVTFRQAARMLRCSRLTVDRKFQWLAKYAEIALRKTKYDSQHIQFDEMETLERTKLLPLTIALAVDENYKILSVQVGKIPSKGRHSKIALKKYGPRPSERERVLEKMFLDLKVGLLKTPLSFTSDQFPTYPGVLRKHYPDIAHTRVSARHVVEKKREMPHLNENKKVFDPMFALNQRCAKLRADIKRLTRRSWCVTQKIENLQKHLLIYQCVNNAVLIF